jgi:hypothetical protein
MNSEQERVNSELERLDSGQKNISAIFVTIFEIALIFSSGA